MYTNAILGCVGAILLLFSPRLPWPFGRSKSRPPKYKTCSRVGELVVATSCALVALAQLPNAPAILEHVGSGGMLIGFVVVTAGEGSRKRQDFNNDEK